MTAAQFLSLLKWDLILLNRNKLILISLGIAATYVGIFYLLKPLGNLDLILVIMIFNDPVVTGLMFAGVMILFDRQQNTLEALQVLPMPFKWYLISKGLLLGILSVVIALLMSFAVRGLHFNAFHLINGVFLTAAFFSCVGFILGRASRTFNHYLVYMIGFLIPMAIPLLWLFGIGEPELYMVFPSFAGLVLIKAAYTATDTLWLLYAYAYLALSLFLIWKLTLRRFQNQSA